MSQTTDESPDGLETHPRPAVQRFGKRSLYLALVVVLALLAVLAVSIHDEKPVQRAEEQKAPEVDAKVPALVDAPEGGLAVPPKRAPEPAATTPSGAPVPKGRNSGYAEALRQDQERVRQYRMQQELQALQAPLSVGNVSAGARPVARPVAATTAQQGARDRGAQPGATADTPSEHYDQADRKDKEGFLNGRSGAPDEWTLQHTRVPGALCEIKTGTVIPGIMLTGINSDLPGKLIAQVSQHVYDTATGNMLVIPQGSRLFGVYDSRVAVGQERVLIAWNRVIFPDGSSVSLDTMPGTDQAGYAGLTDEVNNHYLRIFGSAMVMSLITGGMSYAVDSMSGNSGSSQSDKPTMQDEMGTALATQLGQASLQLLQQSVNIKPTLEIRPGYRFNLVVVKDVIFDRPYVATR